MSQQYGIAAGHEFTVHAAKEILKAGGNAVDAGIGAFVAAFVAEPAMASAGGGAFALVRTPDGKVRSFDFFCQTPETKRPTDEIQFIPITIDFGDAQEVYYCGAGSCAVPGSIAGIFEMHRHYGHMPLSELFQPAIEGANQGVPLNPFQRLDLTLLKEIIGLSDVGAGLYLDGDEVLPLGTIIGNAQFADFLNVLALEGSDFFYKGEISRLLADQHQELGGHLTRKDIESYEVLVGEATRCRYKGLDIFTSPYPSAGGAILTRVIKAFERELPTDTAFHNNDHLEGLYHILVELDHFKKDIDQLFEGKQHGGQTSKMNRRGSTSHLNVMDDQQMGVTITMTNGEGSGLYIPGTGIHMNNMLGEMALQPRGLHTWEENTRLNSMMAPTVVQHIKSDEILLMGTGGSSRIPFMLAQVIDNIYNHGFGLEDAINAPRVHFEHGVYQVEDSQNPRLAVMKGHEVRHWKNKSLFFGGVHAVHWKDKVYHALGDHRRLGSEGVRN